jgi:hypothetical protein
VSSLWIDSATLDLVSASQGLHAGTVTLAGQIIAATNSTQFVSAPRLTLTSLNTFIGYYRGKSVRDGFGTATMLHIASIAPPLTGTTVLEVRGIVGSFRVPFIFNATEFVGFIVLVPPGDCAVAVGGADKVLCRGHDKKFHVSGGELFVDVADAACETLPDGLGPERRDNDITGTADRN